MNAKYQPVPAAPLEGAVFYGRYAGNARSRKLESFAEALDFAETHEVAGVQLPFIGFAAATESECFIWDGYKHAWVKSDLRDYPYQVGPVSAPIGPREVSRVEFDAMRSAGIEDCG